jgi:uncharacterized SAM-binding protein YcdF (DUF218 family)
MEKQIFIAAVRLAMVVVVCFLLSVGFFASDSLGDGRDLPQTQPNEGLVIFTGGTNRIDKGANALLSGYDGPVLVSGVFPGITVDKIFAAYPLTDEVKARVALDYGAQSTAGNVVQTRAWAQRQGITTVRVVTSTYHTARSRLLFRRYAPDLAVTIHQVSPERGNIRIWVKEYTKYVLILLGVEAFLPSVNEPDGV